MLIQGYQELHAYNGIYSYYTGINLLYMVILGQICFHEETRFSTIDVKLIYEKSKPSLRSDNTHDAYYVTMSNLEFQLLLNRQGVIEKVESFLANEEPHPSLVERSLRQMHLFIDKTATTQHPVSKLFQKASSVLEGYCNQFGTNPSK